MARKKKSKDMGATQAPMAMDMPPRISLSIEGAENGSIIHLSGDSGGPKSKYFTKNLVAPNLNRAIRISTSHLRSMATKTKMKKASGRKGAARKKV